MALGIFHKLRSLRSAAIVAFTAVIVKLATYDIWRFDLSARIAVLVALGVALIAVSMSYKKFKRYFID